MVKKAVIHKITRLIYAEFKGKCVPLGEVVDFIKKSDQNVSYSLVKLALDMLEKDGKVKRIKLYKFYTVYCIGKDAKFVEPVEPKKVEECVDRMMPSFTLMQLTECVIGHRPVGSPSALYAAVLYVLARMVREGKIYSFTVLRNSKDRLKVIIQR